MYVYVVGEWDVFFFGRRDQVLQWAHGNRVMIGMLCVTRPSSFLLLLFWIWFPSPSALLFYRSSHVDVAFAGGGIVPTMGCV